ncbi:MAG: tetratricopeptide repeat protein [Pseudomonadales bacterium]|jgi:hypothetical protein|nr:tetratricopeptide repeat protein [Pseudomonadales bacterium]
MERHIKPLVLFVALAAGSSAWAGTNAEDLATLRSEMTHGNTAVAWSHAQRMRADWEATPEFDYLYGLLAYEQGQYNESQFALERVVLSEPANTRARLALGKAYYQLGDEHSALRQFNAVKISEPPAYIMREVNHYLARMGKAQRGTINGYVESGIGHDSNINSATTSNAIANPAFDPSNITSDPYILLNKQAHQQSDMYDYLQAGLSYYKPLDADTGIEANVGYNARNNFSSDRFDSNTYRGSVGIVKLYGKDQVRATFTAQDYRLSDSDFQNYYSLSVDWTHYNYGGWSLYSALFLNRLKYPDDSLRDINQYIGNFAIQRQDGAISQSIGVMLGDEDARHARGDNNARTFTGAYYNISYDLATNHQLFARAYLQNSHQKDQDPFFLQTRDDNFQQYSVGWNWQLSKPLRIHTELVYDTNSSDVDYYSFERTRLQTGLRYSF